MLLSKVRNAVTFIVFLLFGQIFCRSDFNPATYPGQEILDANDTNRDQPAAHPTSQTCTSKQTSNFKQDRLDVLVRTQAGPKKSRVRPMDYGLLAASVSDNHCLNPNSTRPSTGSSHFHPTRPAGSSPDHLNHCPRFCFSAKGSVRALDIFLYTVRTCQDIPNPAHCHLLSYGIVLRPKLG